MKIIIEDSTGPIDEYDYLGTIVFDSRDEGNVTDSFGKTYRIKSVNVTYDSDRYKTVRFRV